MKNNHALTMIFFFLATLTLGPGCPEKNKGETVAETFKLFVDPPASYRSAPLWVWNDRVSKEQIETQLADFKAKGFGGVFIHPRPGLITPYLSEEWFTLCRHAVETGKKLGLSVWLYDENSYPSGFAGGHVPAEMPEAAGQGLRMVKATELPESFSVAPLLVLRSSEVGFLDITPQALDPAIARKLGKGEYYFFYREKASPSPWFAGFTYVDLMRREVTEKFLQITLDAYKEIIGDEFGLTVPGVFQDEAHIAPVGGKDVINFTPGLFEAFRKKWGYDLRFHLPSLFEERGDWRRIRHNYYALLLDLFIQGWAKPYYDYCEQNRLLFTGHYWEHEWPVPRLCPDNMAMAAYAHMPGIDCLMNDWQMGPHAQFGNARAIKEVRSVANQLGKRRTLSETYGAGGWDMTLTDQKRIADWEFSLGINFINPHLSFMTITGTRKRDHPLSFSYHEPWWPAYRMLADYLARLAVAMSSGEQVNSTLVLEPTTTAWMYYSPAVRSRALETIGWSFQDFVNRLEAEHIEYDLASEEVVEEHGRVKKGKLVIGQRAYNLVVIPPGLENLNSATAQLLGHYVRRRGRVLSVAGTPSFVDGRSSDQFAKLALRYPARWRNVDWPGLTEMTQMSGQALGFTEIKGPREFFFHQRRKLGDGELLFLANISPAEAIRGRLLAPAASVEKWDPWTGHVSPFPAFSSKGRIEVAFEIPSGGSLLLCLKKGKMRPFDSPPSQRLELELGPDLDIQREKPNVLTLDYCDLQLGGKEERGLYFYEAQTKIFRHHGLGRNPWDNAVQFKTEILDLDPFPPTSGFEATYWFEAEPGVRLETLELVVERPALYQVFVNGQSPAPVPDRWWLDRAFGVFEIGELVKVGKNKITLRARPLTVHTELEPIYLRGDFSLKNKEKGFELGPARELSLGPWSAQGLPFYPDSVSYSRTLKIDSLRPERERVLIKLGDWRGSVAEIRVNGQGVGFLISQPFELDITDHLKSGFNQLDVVVYGTLKNTLGPHHNNPPLGKAWPGSFQQGAAGGIPPGSAYHVVAYGLFEDFKAIVERKAR